MDTNYIIGYLDCLIAKYNGLNPTIVQDLTALKANIKAKEQKEVQMPEKYLQMVVTCNNKDLKRELEKAWRCLNEN